jgi:hypothetical protein
VGGVLTIPETEVAVIALIVLVVILAVIVLTAIAPIGLLLAGNGTEVIALTALKLGILTAIVPIT